MTTADPPLTNTFPQASEADWRKRVELILKGADFDRKLVHRTYDGVTVRPLYKRQSDAGLITGALAGKPWRVMARVDHPAVEQAAKLAIADLEGGADALALVFSGSRSARGFGLDCKTVADLDAALDGVRVDMIDIRLDTGSADITPVQLLARLIETRKLDSAQLRVDFGMDPVAALHSGGYASLDAPMKLAVETACFLMERGFKGPFFSVDLRPYHDAGASEGQELAAALAQGVLYLRALETKGLSLDAARKCLSFVMPLDADQFLGMAKVRALRKLWQQVELSCGLAPQPILLHAETSWRMMTKRDSYVNILRATIATFAAGIGGADSVTVLPFTQALGLPDEQARRLARNTSIVLQEESNLWRVVDPSAGAGGFEAMTEALSTTAWGLFQQIEREGGLAKSLMAGLLQARVCETHTARMRAIATRKEPLTGTSEFANTAETTPNVLPVKPVAVQRIKSTISHLAPNRVAEPFEQLRDRADAVLVATGKRPQVQLITLGPLVDHTARLAFMRNFFEAGGFDVLVLTTPQEGRGIACIVGSDAAYAETAAVIAKNCTESGKTVWLAGKPGELEPMLTKAGIARFVFAGCDVVEALGVAHNVFINDTKNKIKLTEEAQ